MIGRWALCGVAVAGLLGPPNAVAEEGNIFSNLLKYGGTTVPPSRPQELEAPYCPTIDVLEGGAALTAQGGKGGVRSQITFGQLARECTRLQDGSVGIKVGIDARVLLGPGGAPGRFEAPVTIAIKHNEKVVSQRVRRIPIVVGPGEAQGFATVVEEGIVVPLAMSGDYEIAVGLSGLAKSSKPKPRRKPAVATAPEGGDPAAAQ